MFVLLFENMLPKSNAYANVRIIASLFLNREYKIQIKSQENK